jgi:hypothetical protein
VAASSLWQGQVRWRGLSRVTGSWLSVNMISAVTATGSVDYDIIHGSLDAAKFIDFCNKLLSDTDCPVFLVVDGRC